MNYVEEIGRLDRLQNRRKRFAFLALLFCLVAGYFAISSLIETLSTLELPSLMNPNPTAQQVLVTVEAVEVQATATETNSEPSPEVASDLAATRQAQSNAVQNAIRGNR